MTKKEAIRKAIWLSKELQRRYCVVKYYYGFDAEVFSAAIPETDIYFLPNEGRGE
jgi:hypothetical protein